MKMNSWQKLLLFAAMTLLVLGVTACAGRAQAAPALQESPTAVPEEEAAPAETDAAETDAAETDAAETDAAETDAAEPAAAEEQATEAEKPAEPTMGYETYVTVMPAASGGGTRVIALRLYEDGTLTWDTQFHNNEPPIEEIGAWVDNGDGTITVTVTGREDATYDEPKVIVFEADETGLVAVEYDESLYGSEGLTLLSVVDVAANVEHSLFTLDLSAGTPLDPTFMTVNAGGAVPANLLGPECTGFVNAAPVVTVNWSGQADFIEAFVVSNDDPTLVVLTPDGTVLCNDDANEQLLDPVVQIDNPVEGTYRIWAGSFYEGHLLPGILVLTTKPEVNLGTFDLASFIQREQVPEVLPEPEGIADRQDILETLETALAESPALTEADLPTEVEVVADGLIPLFQLPLGGESCAGLVSGAPSYTFNWTGAADDLRIMFEGDGDSSLLVIGPGMDIVCADDSADDGNRNPVVDLGAAMTGLHAVYVGRIDPSAPVTGVLSITDMTDEPAVLAPAGQ